LHDKWTLYDTEVCPRCFESAETDQHIWNCPKSRPALMAISDELDTKYRLPNSLIPSITLLAQGIPTLALTQFLKGRIKTHLSLLTDDLPSVEDISRETLKTLLNITHAAYTNIWIERYKASSIY